jgi:hypothetical protein
LTGLTINNILWLVSCSETIGLFVQGSKTFRKPSLKAHEKSDEHINNCKREYAKKNPQGLESLS